MRYLIYDGDCSFCCDIVKRLSLLLDDSIILFFPFKSIKGQELISYYKKNEEVENELNTYKKYLNDLNNSPQFLNSYAWRMSELEINLDDALEKVNNALQLLISSESSYPNILDTKAEVLWKMKKNEQAVLIIEQAIRLNPESEYYKAQKEKFINSNN